MKKKYVSFLLCAVLNEEDILSELTALLLEQSAPVDNQ